MKLSIQQGVLLKALEKGAIAAMSDVAQSDTSNMALLIQSVKITADKNFTIESSTNLMAVKYSVPIGDQDCGIVLKEEGCVMAPAKELMEWTRKQSSQATIQIALSKYKTAQMVSTAAADTDEAFSIKKVGEIKVVCKNNTNGKGTSKWSLDCYDPEHIKSVDFKKKPAKQFEVKVPHFTKALKTITFASLPKDYEHVLDSVSVQRHGDDLYFATTDTKRCALYKLDEIEDLHLEDPMLIPVALLEQVSKISEEGNTISFYYDEKMFRVFLTQKNLQIRLATADKDAITKFPQISMLLDKKYDKLTIVEKSEFFRLLDNASLVNSASALFSFSDKDGSGANCGVKALSESSKYDPLVYTIKAGKIEKSVGAVWGVTHLIEALKIIGEDLVVLSTPDNLKSVKVVGDENKNFSYFAMVINNPKYADS